MSEPDAFKISEAVIDLWRCYTIERDMAKELEAENARLKAEVERLKAEPDALTAYLYADTLRRDDIKTLKAQVERLTKAGDAMVEIVNGTYCVEPPQALKDWNAAKEGKPQP
jgi:hypothetical protein